MSQNTKLKKTLEKHQPTKTNTLLQWAIRYRRVSHVLTYNLGHVQTYPDFLENISRFFGKRIQIFWKTQPFFTDWTFVHT